MKIFKKCIVGLLVLSITGLYFPRDSFCESKAPKTPKKDTAITRHEPQVLSMAAKELKGGAGGSKKWLWIGLGVVALGGLAAAASGGSSGGQDKGTPDNKGSITVGW